MKTLISLILLLFASIGTAETLFPMPSVPDITEEDGWAFALGASLEYEAEYDGSDEYGVEAEPAFIVQKRTGNQMWFFEGQELGWRGRLSDLWLVQGGVRFEGGREESESPKLAGLGDTDDEIVGMFEARRALGSDWRSWAAARAMAGGSGIGWLGVFAAGHTFAASEPGMGIDVFAFVTLASDTFINRDFGVTEEQSANSGLPVTSLDGGYRSFGIQAAGRWRFGEHWQLQAEAGFEKYNSDISDSPIALEDYEAEVGLSLLYRF
jgi:outer membrane scaffolding protein for murein synthesis (MipA/OmpV family)